MTEPKLLQWPKNNNVFDVQFISTHDGDTFRCIVELPFYLRAEMYCRIAGLNAIEIDEPGGEEARDFLDSILYSAYKVSVRSIKPDEYNGRFDGVVLVEDTDGVHDVGAFLIKEGYAAPWNGKGPKPKPVWPRVNAGPVN
jgi:endonuclease YncB( thermonuclease family)